MILGIQCFGNEASASLVGADGHIIAAVEEERFSRRKREGRFPAEAIRACLRIARADIDDIATVAIPCHPAALLFQRLLWTNTIRYPVSPSIWGANAKLVMDALRVADELRARLGPLGDVKLRYYRHHFAHAASAYYPSPFDECAYLTIDGSGEVETVTWGEGTAAKIRQLGRLVFPHSIGKLYSAVCRFLGFDRAEKAGTVMALAATGEPRYLGEMRRMLRVDPERGMHGIRLDTRFFDLRAINLPSPKMAQLLRVPRRHPNDPIDQPHRDIAASLQLVAQEAILHLVRELHRETGATRLVMAGGVALNSVTNGLILQESPFREIFIQPAAHDGGLSVGAALLAAHETRATKASCIMKSAALGPEYSAEEIRAEIRAAGYESGLDRPADLPREIAGRLARGEIVAVFRGRLEFGPRALGNRSILADPRRADIQERLNVLKGRESFRPFAAAILHDLAKEWLERAVESPFMNMVDFFKPELRASVPGVQHVDGSVRVQTIRADVDPFFYAVIRAFAALTGVPLVLNTSLNMRGEPLACSPADALRFFSTGAIEAMALGPYLVSRTADEEGLATCLPDAAYQAG